MSFSENVSKFRLPLQSTEEKLSDNWNHVIRFGNNVIVAGYYFNGRGAPSYFACFYVCSEKEFSCEALLECVWCSDVKYEDAGHAILGAMKAMSAV